MNVRPRVILAGGSGFLGRALTEPLHQAGYDVVVLSRHPDGAAGAARCVQWDGRSPGAWAVELEGAHGVINLTGKSVNCRYTPEARAEIIRSRVDSVRALGEAFARCAQPPRVLVQASSLAIYGNPGARVCTEDSPHGSGFSVGVCEQWEAACDALPLPATRKVILRIGLALQPGEGALRTLEKITRLFLGGTVGSGRQFMSWIHLADLKRMFLWALEREDLSGRFNATGPAPAPNAEFMRELRRALRRPWSPPVPAPLVRLGAWLMGTEGDLALHGFRAVPERFLAHGFEFGFPELRGALADLYGAGGSGETGRPGERPSLKV